MKRIVFGFLILVAALAVISSPGSVAWFSDEEASSENTFAAGTWDYPPTVAITSPSDGATISGTVSIEAVADDDFIVERVEFYYDSTLISTDTDFPYSAAWDSTSVSNDIYTLTALVVDSTFQTASDSIDVFVNN